MKPKFTEYFPWIIYIYIYYHYYNSSILDIEHSPYYIALGFVSNQVQYNMESAQYLG